MGCIRPDGLHQVRRIVQMQWFYNRKIRTKLLLGFCVIVGMTIGLGIFGLMELAKLHGNTAELANNWLPSTRVVSDINTNVMTFRLVALQHILSRTDEDRTRYETSMTKTLDTLKTNQALYEPLISSN